MKKLNDNAMSQVVAGGAQVSVFKARQVNLGYWSAKILSRRYNTLRILPRLMGFGIVSSISAAYSPTLVMGTKVEKGALEAFDTL